MRLCKVKSKSSPTPLNFDAKQAFELLKWSVPRERKTNIPANMLAEGTKMWHSTQPQNFVLSNRKEKGRWEKNVCCALTRVDSTARLMLEANADSLKCGGNATEQ